MTLSILGRCSGSRLLGIGMVSGDPFVGAYGPHASAGYICVAQAQSGPDQARKLLRQLEDGLRVTQAVESISALPEAERWQMGCLGIRDDGAAFTGGRVFPWAGQAIGLDCISVGNALATATVCEATANGFGAVSGPLSHRLISGLSHGVLEGGDKRGSRAGRLLVVDFSGRAVSDIRVDDHPDPIGELQRLLALEQERAEFGPLLSQVLPMIDRAGESIDPGISLDEAVARLIQGTNPGERAALQRFAAVIRHAQPLRGISLRDLRNFLS